LAASICQLNIFFHANRTRLTEPSVIYNTSDISRQYFPIEYFLTAAGQITNHDTEWQSNKMPMTEKGNKKGGQKRFLGEMG
jgi:hypothetical protein